MEIDINDSINDILDFLVRNQNICFKNQQRDETDLTNEQKLNIAKEIYHKSKSNFLLRFGKHMSKEQLEMFAINLTNSEEDSEIKLILENLIRSYCESNSGLKTKNRRYEALKKLVNENSYFSEVEMMKRNPLLYEQLVGQYLNEEERRERDRMNDNNTLVKLLLEGMERDAAYDKKKQQEEAEDNAMEETESDDDDALAPREPKPSTSRWGEFPDLQEHTISKNALCSNKHKYITHQERELLKDEFTTIMYANFLNGHDDDFDYTTVDSNDAYDNLDILEHDEEDKYFDSEEPDDTNMESNDMKVPDESSEDELDIYMNALNQHPTVIKLSEDLEHL